MNKGIVMEKHRRYVIIMTNEGVFQKVKLVKDAEIGEEAYIESLVVPKSPLSTLKKLIKTSMPMRVISIACILAIFFIPIYFTVNVDKTYAYVNIDINPSVELHIDDKLAVRSLIPLNEDGKKLISKLKAYKGKRIEKVIEMIMKQSVDADLISNGKNMLVGVSYANNNEKDKSVLARVQEYFSQTHSSWDITTFQVPKEIRDEAEQKKIAMNKLMAEEISGKGSKQLTGTNVSDTDQAIIESFYNKKAKKEREKGNDPVQLEQHESEINNNADNSYPAEINNNEKQTDSNNYPKDNQQKDQRKVQENQQKQQQKQQEDNEKQQRKQQEEQQKQQQKQQEDNEKQQRKQQEEQQKQQQKQQEDNERQQRKQQEEQQKQQQKQQEDQQKQQQKQQEEQQKQQQKQQEEQQKQQRKQQEEQQKQNQKQQENQQKQQQKQQEEQQKQQQKQQDNEDN